MAQRISEIDPTLLRLRERWETIPFSDEVRKPAAELLAFDDASLEEQWEFARRTTSEGRVGFGIRGWYQLLYQDWVRGRKILDIGTGLGIDGVHFAGCGARTTFVDVVPTNVEIARRICRIKRISDAQFLVLNDIADLDTLDGDYDAVFAFGSLLHAPPSIAKAEFAALARRLKTRGRFIMHAYPRSRWEREGALPFTEWGTKTDGVGTPWAEWYDVAKLRRMLAPARFEALMYCEYRGGDMNAIDLIKVDDAPEFAEAPLPRAATPLPQALDLESIRVYDCWPESALVRDELGAEITTAPAPWAFSAELVIDRSRLSTSGPFFLQFDVVVERGEIGIAALHVNESEFIAERRVSADDGPVVAHLELASLDDVKAIIVRNTCRDGLRSRARLRSLVLYTAGVHA